MPLIYELICDHCKHIHSAPESVTYVILEDGSEEMCLHPIESMMAEEKTGKAWSELRNEGRIIYRYPLVCISCGDMNYYGPHDLNVVMPPQSHLRSIIQRPSKRVASLYNCRTCGEKSQEPLGRYAGLTRSILNWIGKKRWLLDCKHCGEGKYIPRLGLIS